IALTIRRQHGRPMCGGLTAVTGTLTDPARDFLQLSAKMLPRQVEIQGSCPDAVALDDDIEVRLHICGCSGVEQHPAGRPVPTDVSILRICEDLVEVRRI